MLRGYHLVNSQPMFLGAKQRQGFLENLTNVVLVLGTLRKALNDISKFWIPRPGSKNRSLLVLSVSHRISFCIRHHASQRLHLCS